jgi:hypothetical protein
VRLPPQLCGPGTPQALDTTEDTRFAFALLSKTFPSCPGVQSLLATQYEYVEAAPRRGPAAGGPSARVVIDGAALLALLGGAAVWRVAGRRRAPRAQHQRPWHHSGGHV